MAGNLAVFDQKSPSATLRVVFDFTSALGAGVTLSSPTVSAVVWTGVDPSPGGLISGSAAVSGATVTQLLVGGVAGVIYKLTCTVGTSDGQSLVMYGYVAVIGDPL